jgi:putative ABC transport system permease protein
MKSPGALLVRALLALFPGRFRERFGDELLTAYHDQRDALRTQQPGTMASWRHLGRTSSGLVRALVPVHLDQRLERRRRARLTPPRGDSTMRNVLADVRQTLRLVRNQPGFATVAILTLALGIGANTAVFTVLNSVILSPLPYDQPGELVRLYSATTNEPGQEQFLTAPDVVGMRDEIDAFSSMAVSYTYREVGGDLGDGTGPPQRIRLMPVNADYFSTLGATPVLGRTFTRDEEVADLRRVVLSHGLWTSATNRDPDIIGRTTTINGESWEVIGVMRPTFRDVVTGDVAAWTPANLVLAGSNHRDNHYLTAVARLAPGISLAQAQARVDVLMRRLSEEFPNANSAPITRVVPLHEDVVGESTTTVYILMGAASLVLLIACLNVANLFIARSLTQSRETAIRTALGAARSRLVSQRLTESVLLSAVGGIAGSVVAYWGVRILLAVSPDSLARAEEIGVDATLLAFALVLTIVTGIVFGAWPAFRASRSDPRDALHDGARGTTISRAGRRARGVLVASQVALALVLLAGAGVLVRSLIARQQMNLGFDSSGVATFEVHLPPVRYGESAARVRFHDEYQERLRALPGVEAVGVTSWLPANGHYHQWGLKSELRGDEWISAQVRVIDGDFLDVMRIPLLSGRTFTPTDRVDTDRVALISRSLARRAFGVDDPVGQRVTLGPPFTVVGVVDDVAYEAQGTQFETLYLSHDQFASNRNWALTYTVRTRSAPDAVVTPARAALAEIDPGLVLHQPRAMDEVLSGHWARQRFTLLLMATFALVALTLAAVGVYGVLSYAVTQRTHEIGVRMALGARPAQVRLLVMGDGLLLAIVGMAVGLAAAFAVGDVLGALTFGVNPRDPLVFGTVTLVLAVVIVIAGYVPARRATRVDPLESLRGD